MTKAALVEQVTAAIARTSGPMISKKDCARVVDAFLDAVKQALKEQQNIEIRGFGAFHVKEYKGYQGRNPKTSETIEVRPKRGVLFRTGKELRERVNAGAARAASITAVEDDDDDSTENAA